MQTRRRSKLVMLHLDARFWQENIQINIKDILEKIDVKRHVIN